MWVLDVVSPAKVSKSFYLTQGEWIIGRKNCHIELSNDSSISRKHAIISIDALADNQLSDLTSRPIIRLIDQQSRFGTYVNDTRCDNESFLQENDLITFGGKKTILRVHFAQFVLVTSRLCQENKEKVHRYCQDFGMHIMYSGSKLVTHCIIELGEVFATKKVLWTLGCGQYIVTMSWLEAIDSRANLSDALPSYENHLPRDSSVSMEVSLQYLPCPARKELFNNYVILFVQPSSMEGLFYLMGGTEVCLYELECNDDQRDLQYYLQGIDESKVYIAVTTPTILTEATEAGSHGSLSSWIRLLHQANVTFTTEQELASNIIFLTEPVVNALSLKDASGEMAKSQMSSEEKDVKVSTDRLSAISSEDAHQAEDLKLNTCTFSQADDAVTPYSSSGKEGIWLPTLQSQKSYAKNISDHFTVVPTSSIKNTSIDKSQSNTSQTVNYKKFRKTKHCATASYHTLFPVKMIAYPSSDAKLKRYMSTKGFEEQERIADELFEVIEKKRTRRKL